MSGGKPPEFIMNTQFIRNMAFDLLMADRVTKGAVKEYIRETLSLIDAYDAITNLKVVQESGMTQAKEVFGLVRQMHKMNKSDSGSS